MGMAQKTGMDRSAVIRTYGTRNCQQAFRSGPCHKGLHGYEYKYNIDININIEINT